MTEKLTLNQPGGLLVADEAAFWQKLDVLAANHASDTHVVFDFDRTLTFTPPGAKEVTTSWQILQSHLPEDGRRRQAELFNVYFPKELDGSMTRDEAEDWWRAVLELFTEYKIDLADVEQQFIERSSIRPGTTELFAACGSAGVPTVILSAGVKNVIDMWAKTYAIRPGIVVSTELFVDADERISGWDESSMVHILNKDEVDHPELNKLRRERPNAIVVGDSLRDADMAQGDDSVIRVRILDEQPGRQTNIDEFRRQSFAEFDAVIESNSLLPLVGLVRAITER